MAEDSAPTFHANVVTIQVAIDEVTLEFREFLLPHKEIWGLTQQGTKPLPTPTDSDVFEIPPIAKAVITYTAARALQANLNSLMPQIEEWRRQDPTGSLPPKR